ncbi:DinB family protein [Kordia sp.]|uniref:DinB family protein n=1 Tax=Kordia sp. TaxID=1965332 RepID=UPI003B599AFE
MKKYILLVVIFTVTIAKAQDTPISAFLEKWENSKNYLVEMAEAMPEDKYDYKPTERQKTFREQLLHIKGNMDWLSTTYFSKEKKKNDEKASYTTKAEIVAAIKEAFDNTSAIIKKASSEELKEVVDFFAGPKTKLQILNLLQDHVTHHRGQIIVYLNLNDVKPPRYRGW